MYNLLEIKFSIFYDFQKGNPLKQSFQAFITNLILYSSHWEMIDNQAAQSSSPFFFPRWNWAYLMKSHLVCGDNVV